MPTQNQSVKEAAKKYVDQYTTEGELYRELVQNQRSRKFLTAVQRELEERLDAIEEATASVPDTFS